MCAGGLIVLLPINITASHDSIAPNLNQTYVNSTAELSYFVQDEEVDTEESVIGMAKLTMANVPQGDSILTVHAIFVVVFSLFGLFVIWQMYRRFIAHRGRYLYSKNGRTFTVLVKEIPWEMVGDREKMISWFEERYAFNVYFLHCFI